MRVNVKAWGQSGRWLSIWETEKAFCSYILSPGQGHQPQTVPSFIQRSNTEQPITTVHMAWQLRVCLVLGWVCMCVRGGVPAYLSRFSFQLFISTQSLVTRHTPFDCPCLCYESRITVFLSTIQWILDFCCLRDWGLKQGRLMLFVTTDNWIQRLRDLEINLCLYSLSQTLHPWLIVHLISFECLQCHFSC